MPSLRDLLAMSEHSDDLVVVPGHAQWMERPESERTYSPEALQHAMDVLTKAHQHERSGRFSPSSMGECNRKLLFGFVGAPQTQEDNDNLDLMAMGSGDHFWWQLEGLTAGWMKAAEVWVHNAAWHLGGSMDGILVDDSIFELKTMFGTLYDRYVLKEQEPKWQHLIQVECYMRLSGLEKCSLVYQERGGAKFHEFRIERREDAVEEVDFILEQLHDALETNKLPAMLDQCEMRTGKVYRQCSWRKHCPTVSAVR